MKVKRLLAGMAAGAVAACSGEGVGPSAETLFDRDVALFAVEGAAQDVEVMRGPGGRFAFGLGANPGSFECGTFDRNGVTVERTCEYLDIDGNTQTVYDELTTESVVVSAAVNGTVDRHVWTGTVDRQSDLVVTGLAGVESSMFWTGTGNGAMSRIRQTRDGGEAQFDMSSVHTVTDLEIPVPRTDDGWPLDGTISSSVTVSITGGPMEGNRERDVTIVFDGTQFATVTVGGETFTVDLANREHRGPAGRRSRGRGPGRR